jgi:diketogulonate reductase-like aldo/keto reductase
MTPAFLYGTAWKEDETERLVRLALQAGFRGFDTANQRKHYHEAGVGQALAAAYPTIAREALFLQTKFTFVDGQDQRLPYDPKAEITTQVQQSFASSLEHLGTTYLDSYLLHGPSRRSGLGPIDWEAWRAMEALAASGQAKALGISNVSLAQLDELLGKARVAPAYVQNRCYASRGWDGEVRELCAQHQIRYQGFSLLTANPEVLRSATVKQLAARVRRTPSQVIFRFALQRGILPLTGTTDPVHLKDDLEVLEFALEDADLRAIESV